jgi:hypothetical protein
MIMIAGGMYIGSYVSFRNHRIERGEHDKQAYVIFPKNRLIMYYIYRPLMYIDASLTGMQFHIGPHEDEGQEAQWNGDGGSNDALAKELARRAKSRNVLV